MQPDDDSPQVFITHVRNDRQLIELSRLLASELEARSFKVWTEERVSPEANEEQEVEKALRESGAMIALLSQHAYSSSYVRNELEHALFDERYRNRVLPVFIGTPEKEDYSRLPWVLMKMDYLLITSPADTQGAAKQIADRFETLLQSGSAS